MTDHFDETVQCLWERLGALGRVDAQRKLKAVEWTVRDGPAIGLKLAQEAGEGMKQGRDIPADDLVSQTVASYWHTTDCYHRSRFALESTVRYLHAGGDLLAQVINEALALGVSESACSLRGVESTLSTNGPSPSLYAALHAFSASPQFSYVAAATNRMKHRDLMPGEIQASVADNSDVVASQRLLGFCHDGRHYSAYGPDDIAAHATCLRELIAAVLDNVRSAL